MKKLIKTLEKYENRKWEFLPISPIGILENIASVSNGEIYQKKFQDENEYGILVNRLVYRPSYDTEENKLPGLENKIKGTIGYNIDLFVKSKKQKQTLILREISVGPDYSDVLKKVFKIMEDLELSYAFGKLIK